MDQALQQLIDRQAIADLMQRYARTLDWLDDDGQRGCYWPDAEIDYGLLADAEIAYGFFPRPRRRLPAGGDGDRARIGPALAHAGRAARLVHRARRRRSRDLRHLRGATRQEDGTLAGNLFGGRYLDRFERRGGEWRVAKRLYVLDWRQRLADQPGFDADPDFPLPVLKIDRSGHDLYRPM